MTVFLFMKVQLHDAPGVNQRTDAEMGGKRAGHTDSMLTIKSRCVHVIKIAILSA